MPRGRRTPPDTFRKAVDTGYWDVYEYLPGWKTTPLAQRRSVLLGRVQIVGLHVHRIFPADGEWPREFEHAYAEGIEWLMGRFRELNGEDWSALSVPVRAGDSSGRRTTVEPAPVEIIGMSNKQYLKHKAEEAEKARKKALLVAKRKRRQARVHLRRMETDPDYRASVLYKEFAEKASKTHSLYYRI